MKEINLYYEQCSASWICVQAPGVKRVVPQIANAVYFIKQPPLALSLSKFTFLSPVTEIKIKDMVEITDRLAPGPGFLSNLRPIIDVFELEDPQLLKTGWNGSAPQRVHGRHAVRSAAVCEANFMSSPEHPYKQHRHRSEQSRRCRCWRLFS